MSTRPSGVSCDNEPGTANGSGRRSYALTPDGRSVRSPGFVDYGPDGLAVNEGKFYRLDVERTWLLVKALITAPGADVQWLFLAGWLEALLVEHARARGETDEIVHRAESVLLQPGDSTPHAEHLHVRLACTPDELVAGCAGGGPRWRWLAPMPQLPATSDQDLIASIIGDLLPPGAMVAAASSGVPSSGAVTSSGVVPSNGAQASTSSPVAAAAAPRVDVVSEPARPVDVVSEPARRAEERKDTEGAVE